VLAYALNHATVIAGNGHKNRPAFRIAVRIQIDKQVYFEIVYQTAQLAIVQDANIVDLIQTLLLVPGQSCLRRTVIQQMQ